MCVMIGILSDNITTGTKSFGVLLLDTSGVVDSTVVNIEDNDCKPHPVVTLHTHTHTHVHIQTCAHAHTLSCAHSCNVFV